MDYLRLVKMQYYLVLNEKKNEIRLPLHLMIAFWFLYIDFCQLIRDRFILGPLFKPRTFYTYKQQFN